MQVPVPVPEGVKTPACVMVPPVAVQLTAELKAPVPLTLAVHCADWLELIEDGAAVTVIPVTVGGTLVTAMGADPEILVNPACVDVAVQVPVPTPDGVNTPDWVMVPPVAVQVTPLPYAPVPATVATHCAVCAVVMEAGVATTAIDVTVMGAVCTAVVVMDADPDTLVEPACVEVALHDPVPTPEGVKRPDWVMVPPVAVHVTAEL